MCACDRTYTCPDAPRYIVCEHTSYRAMANDHSPKPQQTEVMILDRAYCHRVVWTKYGIGTRLTARRAEAAQLCREWNAEDRADVCV